MHVITFCDTLNPLRKVASSLLPASFTSSHLSLQNTLSPLQSLNIILIGDCPWVAVKKKKKKRQPVRSAWSSSRLTSTNTSCSSYIRLGSPWSACSEHKRLLRCFWSNKPPPMNDYWGHYSLRQGFTKITCIFSVPTLAKLLYSQSFHKNQMIVKILTAEENRLRGKRRL